MLFQLAWNEGFKCSCLEVFIKSCCRRSARGIGAPVPPASRVLRDDLQFAPIWTQEFSQKCSALSSTQRIPRRTKRHSASRPDGAAPRTVSKLSLPVKAKSATWTYSFFSRKSSTGSSPSGPNCCSSVFLSHSANLASPLNIGGFPRSLMSTRLWRSFCRRFVVEIAVLPVGFSAVNLEIY